ncbi:MAG: hypothetical protein HGA38_01210 [Candidatus Moranbacteria bacterium]|nr:hypothetical protein [Candidatus Moranbacteria bacterium]NTW45627.1 hypothetical protein [Candidatus Moranbacteria bacterium]
MRATNAGSEQDMPSADRDLVLREKGLTLVEAGFFRGKENVSRVIVNDSGARAVLKTGRISESQVCLFALAKRIEGVLPFLVPVVLDEGEGWVLLEEIAGESLNMLADSDPERYLSVCWEISESYRRVVDALVQEKGMPDASAEGNKWMLSRLSLWSRPIVDAGFLSFEEVRGLSDRIAHLSDGPGRFGYVHGNVIGDHVILPEGGGKPYLLDLEAVPRIAPAYYDLLRAFDFLLLSVGDSERTYETVRQPLLGYLGDYASDEVNAVLAFRLIGALGWDLLKHSAEYIPAKDRDAKIQLMVRLIRNGIE